MKIVLIGSACCYKTSAGKLIAEKLNCKHIDLDEQIEQTANKSISDIFALYGEAEFRNLERHALLAVADCENAVISCGGGTVTCSDFERLARGSLVVWLKANAHTVVSRLGGIPRPLYDGKSVLDVDKLINARTPYYEKYANLTVNTDGLTSNQVADIVLRQINEHKC